MPPEKHDEIENDQDHRCGDQRPEHPRWVNPYPPVQRSSEERRDIVRAVSHGTSLRCQTSLTIPQQISRVSTGRGGSRRLSAWLSVWNSASRRPQGDPDETPSASPRELPLWPERYRRSRCWRAVSSLARCHQSNGPPRLLRPLRWAGPVMKGAMQVSTSCRDGCCWRSRRPPCSNRRRTSARSRGGEFDTKQREDARRQAVT
jgi:hypothetical protein